MWTGLRSIVTAGLVVVGVLVYSSVAPAAKPGGGGGTSPPPPGTIYYQSSGMGVWQMNGDGSGKTFVTGVDWPNVPTWQRNNGTRWFLENRSGEGIPGDWGQWFAVSESGQVVQLTIDVDLHLNGYPPAWARDDSFFSYSAVYETADEWIGRLFVVAINWTSGLPVAGPPTMVYELREPVLDEWGNYTYGDQVSLGHHDWSPQGNEAALTRWVWGEGWVLDIASFSETDVTTRRLTSGMIPQWSPDGTQIAFNRRRTAQSSSGYYDLTDVWTIKLDGTGTKQLTTSTYAKGSNTQQLLPTWSPDAAYIAFTQQVIKSNSVTQNIQRIPAGGGSPVSLTSDGKSNIPRWRP
jgi:hypothetical protein